MIRLALALLFVLGATCAAMADPAFDASGSATSCDSCTTITRTGHTSSGSDRIILACVGQSYGGSPPPTPTCNFDPGGTNQAMTQIGTQTHSSDNFRTTFFYLAGQATGAKDVTCTVGDTSGLSLITASYTGVHQSSSIGTAATASGTSSTATVDVTSASGETVVDCVNALFPGDLTPGTGQTQRTEVSMTNGGTAVSDEAGAGTVTMSWTNAGSGWGIVAVPLKPVTGGGGGGGATGRFLFGPGIGL